MIGYKPDLKSLGKRSALNAHAAFDEAGAGNTIGWIGAPVLDPTCERLGGKFPRPTRPQQKTKNMKNNANLSNKSEIEVYREELISEYSYIRKVVLIAFISSILELISVLLGYNQLILYLSLFVFGSITAFLRNKIMQAIINGLILIIVCFIFDRFLFSILSKLIIPSFKNPDSYYFIGNPKSYYAYYLSLIMCIPYMIYGFIEGIQKKDYKTGFLGMLGIAISYLILVQYLNGTLRNNLLDIKNDLNGSLPILSKIWLYCTILFWNIFLLYGMIIFQSFGNKEQSMRLFRKLFEINKRLDRRNFLIYYLVSCLFIISVSITQILLFINILYNDSIKKLEVLIPILIIFGVTYISFLAINFIQITKRFHDSNKSAWFWLILPIPIVNFYLFYLMFRKGDNFENKFGLNIYTTNTINRSIETN